jgi:hypothetical protein
MMENPSAIFFAQEESLLQLAQVAESFHTRPSAMLELTGAPAIQLDYAAAQAFWRWQAEVFKEQ